MTRQIQRYSPPVINAGPVFTRQSPQMGHQQPINIQVNVSMPQAERQLQKSKGGWGNLLLVGGGALLMYYCGMDPMSILIFWGLLILVCLPFRYLFGRRR